LSKEPIYPRLKEKASAAARRLGPPSFYRAHKKELERSLRTFSESRVLLRCRSRIDESKLHPAHGIQHGEMVAIEAAAILQIESALVNGPREKTEDLMLCAQIAGLFHDIKRNEQDHTIKGCKEAEKILEDFDLKDRYKRYIAAAIRNHEAFKDVLASEDEEAKLVSDSLYDADKFRWGPDNFTTTLWLIMESSGTPAETLYCIFLEKMKGVGKIKETFRTDTGRRFGPEFIDLGMQIGEEIYREMENLLGGRHI
jgi:hypothetical protein